MAALVYFESTSNKNIYSEPTPIENNDAGQILSNNDFDKQYQEFLSKGEKIVSQETLDSIEQAESNVSLDEPVTNADRTVLNQAQTTNNTSIEPETKRPAPTRSNKSPVTSTPRTTKNDNIGDKPETITLKTPSNSPSVSNSNNKQVLGTLEEATPTDNSSTLNLSSSTGVNADNTITEEFYTEDTITGTISARSDGTSLSGVVVKVKGTDQSTVSDSNGRYSIVVPGDPQYRTISYSYQGNSTQRDVSPGRNVVNVRF